MCSYIYTAKGLLLDQFRFQPPEGSSIWGIFRDERRGIFCNQQMRTFPLHWTNQPAGGGVGKGMGETPTRSWIARIFLFLLRPPIEVDC